MSDHRAPLDELLSAYLDGELDDETAAAVEERIAQDPAFAALLDRTHDVVVALRGLDEVTAPEGFGSRLRERLDAERSVTDLSAARRRRATFWPAVGTVAAAVVALAVVGGGMLSQQGNDRGDEVALRGGAEDAPSAMMAPADEEAAGGADRDEATDDFADSALELDAAPQQAGGGDGADDAPGVTGDSGEGERSADAQPPEAAAPADAESDTAAGGGSGASGSPDASGPTAADASDGPTLVDAQAVLADETAARQRYGDLPDGQRELGMPLDEAREAAYRAREVIWAAERFESGPHPGDCLEVFDDSAESPLVVVRVETVVYGGTEALAYMVVGATADSERLDRIELWITELGGCQTRLFLTL